MAGIVGIAKTNQTELVEKMLQNISHRGWAWRDVNENVNSTIGMNGLRIQENALSIFKREGLARDGSVDGRFAQVQMNSKGMILKRDPIGVAPLYYGWTKEGILCFASEVKALLVATNDIHELPPGSIFDGEKIAKYTELKPRQPIHDSPEIIAGELRKRLERSVEKCIGDGNVGSWLSGGLDSSVLAAIARKKVKKLYTFAAGVEGAPDLIFAREMANYIKAEHFEIIVDMSDILSVLPEVIYHLESFDALLVRSTILNYLLARFASQHVPAVFSGEGGDELFAGYEYLRSIPQENLNEELIDIIGRLHNTALQRVDRSASSHGTLPLVAFLDPDVVDYALQIPAEYKSKDGVEKWILRQAVKDLLPDQILNRRKSKFWQGGGVEDLLLNYAEKEISDSDFEKERILQNRWSLNSKEELLYYRYFKNQFGDIKDLDWMGRTKGAPVA